jgi:gluconolactonase
MALTLDRFETVATGLDHPEGVAWDPTNARVIAGGEAGQVYAIADSEAREVASTGGFMFGVTAGTDGEVFACDYGQANVVRVSADGRSRVWSTGTQTHPLRVPNFCAFDDAGNLYVTDSGTWGEDDGLVFRVSPAGETVVWSEDVPAFPNGCCLTAEGDALLVVESRARRVVRVAIGRDGEAGAPKPVVDLTGSQPDGIALAVDGTMFVGCYRPDRIYRVPPGGEPEVLAEDPDGVVLNQPANVAFIGPDLDRLAVSSLGGWTIVSTDVGLRGLPLRTGATSRP